MKKLNVVVNKFIKIFRFGACLLLALAVLYTIGDQLPEKRNIKLMNFYSFRDNQFEKLTI